MLQSTFPAGSWRRYSRTGTPATGEQAMGMVSEFKEFISKGNVLDLAVGVVIGAAFGKIVTALVDGIVMPIVGVALGGVSVSDWKYVMKPETVDAAGAKVAEVAVQYGSFIQTLIDFLIIAFVIFLVIKAYNRMRKPPVEVAVAPPEDVLLLREIRDSLKR
jgi:large conductance mechanosensitive channel